MIARASVPVGQRVRDDERAAAGEGEPVGGGGAGPGVAAEHAGHPGGAGVAGDLGGRRVLKGAAVVEYEDPVGRATTASTGSWVTIRQTPPKPSR